MRPCAKSFSVVSRPAMPNSPGGKFDAAGSVWLTAAASTPGMSSSRCTVCACRETTDAALSLHDAVMRNVVTPDGSNPGDTCAMRAKLRIRRPAPTSSTTASAICPETSVRCSSRRPAVCARPPRDSASPGSTRAACIAGAAANTTVVAAPSAIVNRTSRASIRSSSMRGSSFASWRSALAPQCATTRPTSAPVMASTAPSARSCRMTAARDAPIANRTAISCSRLVASARSRHATFPQAASSSSATAASSSQSDPRAPPTCSSFSGTSDALQPLSVSGNSSPSRA
ncbi:MAG: hypothetical protein DMF93_12300 [Acidobacteria bacterium]|nr:MAG: hypothetical protein DMF93_12300 [Acidobacteriota bacterium]